MCERTSAMFAIRACRVFCMKNYEAYPDQCGVPGTAGTVIEMANQMRKMVTIEYCQDQYDQAIQKCLKMIQVLKCCKGEVWPQVSSFLKCLTTKVDKFGVMAPSK